MFKQITLLLNLGLALMGQTTLMTVIPQTNSAGVPTTPGEIRWRDLGVPAHYVGFKAAHSISANHVWEMPNVDGTTGKVWGWVSTDTIGWVTAGNPALINAVCDGVTDDGPVISAALSAIAATGGALELPAGRICAVGTSRDVTIPASNVLFDCQGSTILYMPISGQAIYVAPYASAVPYISGLIRNCKVEDGSGASVSSVGIWQESRLGMKYENLSIRGFNGATAAGMVWENSTTSPQFTEQTSIHVFDTFDNTEHLKLINTGGTNSFAYNTVEDWHCTLINPNTGCLMADGSGANSILLFGDSFHVRVNGNGTGPMYTLKLTNGSILERQSIRLLGELTTGAGPLYSVWTDAASEMYATGEVNITGATILFGGAGQTSASLPLPVDPVTQVAGWWAGGGILPQRKCKYGFGWGNPTSGNGGDFKAYLASYGGTENNCYFQIVKRNTDNTNVDVNIQGSGTAERNIIFADALSGHVGFGPNWSWTGGHPQFDVDTLGGTMRTPNVLQMGNSLGMHRNYLNTDSDESFQLLLPAGSTSAAFLFFTVFNNPPNCTATPNTTLLVTGGNPKVGVYAVSPSVNGINIVQTFINTLTGVTSASTFPVTYFVHCTANGS